MKRAEWRTGRSHEEGRLQPGQEARDLLPIRPIARRLREADPASHLLHEGADTCRTLWLNCRMHSWSARRSLRGSSLASAASNSSHGAERFGAPMLRIRRVPRRQTPKDERLERAAPQVLRSSRVGGRREPRAKFSNLVTGVGSAV